VDQVVRVQLEVVVVQEMQEVTIRIQDTIRLVVLRVPLVLEVLVAVAVAAVVVVTHMTVAKDILARTAHRAQQEAHTTFLYGDYLWAPLDRAAVAERELVSSAEVVVAAAVAQDF
jgi:hypothetical protein